jgi:hypothetical protein
VGRVVARFHVRPVAPLLESSLRHLQGGRGMQ